MQTIIYTDASFSEEKSGVAIEIKEGSKSSFYRFDNIKFIDKENNINSIEYLGIILGISLADQFNHKRVIIYCDNLSAINKINSLLFEYPELFSSFTNIQFCWLQNDMEELLFVDYLSRRDFKTNKEFPLEKISYKEFFFNDFVLFKISDFKKYLSYNFLLLKRLLGFEPNIEDLNQMLFSNMFQFDNKHLEKLTAKSFEPSFNLKEKNINEVNHNYRNNPVIQEIQDEDFLFKKTTPPYKIIYSEDKKHSFKRLNEDTIISYKELFDNNLFEDFFDLNILNPTLEKKLTTLLKINKNDKKTFKELAFFIENNIHGKTQIRYILLFVKVFNFDNFSEIFKYFEDLKKKDYRRSVKSLINFYNKNGLFFNKSFI